MLYHLPLVQLPSTTLPTYPLAWGVAYSDPWNSNLFSASSGLENGSGKLEGESDYQRQRLQAFTFGGTPVDHRLQRTGFYLDSLRRFVSDVSRHHRQSSSEDIRSQSIPNKGKNGHGLGAITNNHILLAALQLLLTFQTSISIKGAYLTILSLGVIETNAG